MMNDETEFVLIEDLKRVQELAHALRGNNMLPKREMHFAQRIVKIVELQLQKIDAGHGKTKKARNARPGAAKMGVTR